MSSKLSLIYEIFMFRLRIILDYILSLFLLDFFESLARIFQLLHFVMVIFINSTNLINSKYFTFSINCAFINHERYPLKFMKYHQLINFYNLFVHFCLKMRSFLRLFASQLLIKLINFYLTYFYLKVLIIKI